MVCSSSTVPGSEIGFTLVNEIRRNVGDPYSPTRYKLLFIDYNFIPLYDLKIKAGRNYSLVNGEEEHSGRTILNESAIYALGFKSVDEALGQNINFPLWNESSPTYKIIGIVEDYHHEAIKKQVFPTIFFLNQNSFQQVYYSVKLHAGSDPRHALSDIERSWKEIFPDKPFEYFFLDEYYDRQFKSELHFGRVFALFAGVAVFLACLGILGVTLFEAHARLKEISIRKVLGASVAHLVTLLSRLHIKVVVVAAGISVPIIYVSARQWLLNYPARIELSLSLFLIPLCLVLMLVALTSGFQTVKAANANPVDHLKNE